MDLLEKNDILSLTDIIDTDTEFIPLLSEDEEKLIREEDIPEELPILPLRNNVLFPGVVIPITINRDKSVKLIRDYYKKDRIIGVVAQRKESVEDPDQDDLYRMGTSAYILKMFQMPDGNTTAIIQGRKRFAVTSFLQEEPYFKATVKALEEEEIISTDDEFDALVGTLKDMALEIIKKTPGLPAEASMAINNIESPYFLVNFVSSSLNSDSHIKQELLEEQDLGLKAHRILEKLTQELQMLDLKNQIQKKVKTDLDKQQRDYLLNQQLKTIQEELGGNPNEQEIQELKQKASAKKWGKNIQQIFDKELSKLQRMNPAAFEYSIQLNYLDTLVELPWNEYTSDDFDLKKARKVLDEDHYGLEKVKERIIEHLAVLKLKGDMKSPILCLVGPPGVGKTSLGKSIARALSRKYIRISLGGLRDESEIRGHRKTYIGAMPGRIIQSLKKVKSSNPVFVLDEIDKVMGMNINGDPSAALLEVLDPEQNSSFYDNFLETEYDLSRVMFVATANTLASIHPALRDRMEVIDISGYLLEEKLEIAKRHLLPKQFEEHGVKKSQLNFTTAVLTSIIENYTREAGVRKLEKTIAKLIRNRATSIAMEQSYKKRLSIKELAEILGPPMFQKEKEINHKVPGVVTGLAWTPTGGEILFIEVSLSKGKGNLTLTGNLGDVMKESASIAYEYLKAHADKLDIDPKVFNRWNVHIHVPEGATPKDGPSAGITMYTALASAFTQRKIKDGIAMTGEITLRGKVLPVGGIKEKMLAAKRAKVKTIIVSGENKRDIEDIKKDYVEGLDFVYVDQMTEVTDTVLMPGKVTNPLHFN